MSPPRSNARRGPALARNASVGTAARNASVVAVARNASVVAVALVLAVANCAHAADTPHADILYDITDEQYYQMPRLFELDEYEGCLARGGAFCLGSFELEPLGHSQLYQMMQRYSANWVNNFNHTRLHRGLCLPRTCGEFAPRGRVQPLTEHTLQDWFSTCVNASTWAAYNLSARPLRLEYCEQRPLGPRSPAERPLGVGERAFAALVTALLALAAASTVLDLTLTDHAKKGYRWALAWSVPGCWRTLAAPPPTSATTDLRAFDGLRVICMICIIIEHVCYLNTQTYLVDTRTYEHIRSAVDVMLMVNSTLLVQIFFMMSSFLLAHKLLSLRRRGLRPPAVHSFFDTMLNRIIRVSPSYWVVVWFAGGWWARLGGGPMWGPLVGAEAALCRDKWWTHLLYLNNVLYPHDKCLIQTWYLAADMQLYAAALLLTLALRRWRRVALLALFALLGLCVALLFALAYAWRLLPTYVMHCPESVRSSYRDEASFNVLYQSPLSNAPGALCGLLLAHLHHYLLDRGVRLKDYKLFRWASVAAVPLAAWWMAASPLLLGRGPPGRFSAAALAALERPVFSFFVSLALLGAMQGVRSAACSLLSWSGWSAFARLSFGALLLHMPLNKALVASRQAPAQLDRINAVVEWLGVCALSYLAALPLALLVEIPAMRLHRALSNNNSIANNNNNNITAITTTHRKQTDGAANANGGAASQEKTDL